MTSYRAQAAVTAERGPSGGTVLTRLRSDGPLALRQTTDQTVFMVGAAAGPVGGDDLRLGIRVGPGARLAVRSAATSLALPGPGPGTGAGAGESCFTTHARVEGGGRLDFAPEPTVAVRGSHHRAVSRVELASGAALRWREELVLGRHREEAGRHTGRIDVTLDGVPLLRHELDLTDPDVYSTAAVLGASRAVGSLVLVAPGLTETPGTAEGLAVLPLTCPNRDSPVAAVLVTAVAPDAIVLRRRLAKGEAMAHRVRPPCRTV